MATNLMAENNRGLSYSLEVQKFEVDLTGSKSRCWHGNIPLQGL